VQLPYLSSFVAVQWAWARRAYYDAPEGGPRLRPHARPGNELAFVAFGA
jgi:hypothetical protein